MAERLVSDGGAHLRVEEIGEADERAVADGLDGSLVPHRRRLNNLAVLADLRRQLGASVKGLGIEHGDTLSLEASAHDLARLAHLVAEHPAVRWIEQVVDPKLELCTSKKIQVSVCFWALVPRPRPTPV